MSNLCTLSLRVAIDVSGTYEQLRLSFPGQPNAEFRQNLQHLPVWDFDSICHNQEGLNDGKLLREQHFSARRWIQIE
jgi:hypothetical protein